MATKQPTGQAVTIIFETPDSVRFSVNWHKERGELTEGQMAVVAAEMDAVSRVIRESRLRRQVQLRTTVNGKIVEEPSMVTVVEMLESIKASLATPAAPAVADLPDLLALPASEANQ